MKGSHPCRFPRARPTTLVWLHPVGICGTASDEDIPIEKATHKIKDTFDAATGKAGSDAKKGAKDVEYKTRDLADEAREKADEWTGKA